MLIVFLVAYSSVPIGVWHTSVRAALTIIERTSTALLVQLGHAARTKRCLDLGCFLSSLASLKIPLVAAGNGFHFSLASPRLLHCTALALGTSKL